MSSVSKTRFLSAWGFPAEWETFGLYPDALFAGHQQAVANDTEPHPDEHLRYGAFCWWTRRHRQLPEDTLLRLCELAALDPDPPMAGAAVHDILFHPDATEAVALAAARLIGHDTRWASWFPDEPDKSRMCLGLLAQGRQLWQERAVVQKIAADIPIGALTEDELRSFHAMNAPLVQRVLVEHPSLPIDLLRDLSTLPTGKFSKTIRSMAARRLAGKTVAVTDHARKHATDAWMWPR